MIPRYTLFFGLPTRTALEEPDNHAFWAAPGCWSNMISCLQSRDRAKSIRKPARTWSAGGFY